MKREEGTLAGWNIIWWLFKLFGLPITLPWLVYHFYDIMLQKRRKAALGNKVTSCEVFIIFVTSIKYDQNISLNIFLFRDLNILGTHICDILFIRFRL